MKLDVKPEHREPLKKLLREGDFIHQRLKHTCGYVGNCFHKVAGKWERRTHCPQCGELLTWITLEEALRRISP